MAASLSNGAPQTNGTSKPSTDGHVKSYSAKHHLAAHFIGGNHLKAALSGPVKDFVANSDGHTVITSVWCKPRMVHARVVADQVRVPGADRQQWNRSRERNQIGAEMGVRDLWR